MSSQWASEARAAAATLEHEWDAKAVDWPLTEKSLVVEVGGFKGRWALQIAQLYNPRLIVFEPQQWAAGVCWDVLSSYNVMVHDYALGDHNGFVTLGQFGTDGASILESERAKPAMIGDAAEVLGGLTIDLMLVNIEGYEYILVPYLLECGIKPKRLMIQFHTKFDPGLATEGLRKLLADNGYGLVWDYGDRLAAWAVNDG